MKRPTYAWTIFGIAATSVIFALSGCHSPANNAPVSSRRQPFSPNAGQHQASGIDNNPGLTPAQKAMAKANLQQEYGGATR